MVGRHACVGPHSTAVIVGTGKVTAVSYSDVFCLNHSFNIQTDTAFHLLLEKELITRAFEACFEGTRLLSPVTVSQVVRNRFLTFESCV